MILIAAVLIGFVTGYCGRGIREDSYWGSLNHTELRSWDWRPAGYPKKLFGKHK